MLQATLLLYGKIPASCRQYCTALHLQYSIVQCSAEQLFSTFFDQLSFTHEQTTWHLRRGLCLYSGAALALAFLRITQTEIFLLHQSIFGPLMVIVIYNI